MKRGILLSIAVLLLIGGKQVQAQPKQVLEEVIAVVGENVVLMSDLEKEFIQMQIQYPDFQGDLKCEVYKQLIMQKLLLHKADIDSIVVADDQLEYEINRRIEFYAQQAGGLERLEQYLGESILVYKDRMRTKLREQMLAERAQESLLADVKVSPTEVREFFNSIPEDSVPAFNAEVEVGQIVIRPKPSDFAIEYARRSAQKILDELKEGTLDFCTAASLYNDDEGTKEKCGDLGEFKRGTMVPEFETAAFKLKKDSISGVIRSDYGFHIIQLLNRKGEILHARHILIKPKILSSDHEAVKNQLKGILADIKSGELTFCDAVAKYTEDENTKNNCGFLSDPSVGTNKIEVNYLSPDVAMQIENLNPGEYSIPHSVAMPDRSVAYRIIYLKSEVPPHEADLKDDYQKLSVFALEKKKQEIMAEWMKNYRKTTYVWIDPKYITCDQSPSPN